MKILNTNTNNVYNFLNFSPATFLSTLKETPSLLVEFQEHISTGDLPEALVKKTLKHINFSALHATFPHTVTTIYFFYLNDLYKKIFDAIEKSDENLFLEVLSTANALQIQLLFQLHGKDFWEKFPYALQRYPFSIKNKKEATLFWQALITAPELSQRQTMCHSQIDFASFMRDFCSLMSSQAILSCLNQIPWLELTEALKLPSVVFTSQEVKTPYTFFSVAAKKMETIQQMRSFVRCFQKDDASMLPKEELIRLCDDLLNNDKMEHFITLAQHFPLALRASLFETLSDGTSLTSLQRLNNTSYLKHLVMILKGLPEPFQFSPLTLESEIKLRYQCCYASSVENVILLSLLFSPADRLQLLLKPTQTYMTLASHPAVSNLLKAEPNLPKQYIFEGILMLCLLNDSFKDADLAKIIERYPIENLSKQAIEETLVILVKEHFAESINVLLSKLLPDTVLELLKNLSLRYIKRTKANSDKTVSSSNNFLFLLEKTPNIYLKDLYSFIYSQLKEQDILNKVSLLIVEALREQKFQYLFVEPDFFYTVEKFDRAEFNQATKKFFNLFYNSDQPELLKRILEHPLLVSFLVDHPLYADALLKDNRFTSSLEIPEELWLPILPPDTIEEKVVKQIEENGQNDLNQAEQIVKTGAFNALTAMQWGAVALKNSFQSCVEAIHLLPKDRLAVLIPLLPVPLFLEMMFSKQLLANFLLRLANSKQSIAYLKDHPFQTQYQEESARFDSYKTTFEEIKALPSLFAKRDKLKELKKQLEHYFSNASCRLRIIKQENLLLKKALLNRKQNAALIGEVSSQLEESTRLHKALKEEIEAIIQKVNVEIGELDEQTADMVEIVIVK